MKYKILSVLISIAMLTACSKTPTVPESSGESSESMSTQENSIAESESEPDDNLLFEVDGQKIYIKESASNRKKLDYVFGENGEFNSVTEVFTKEYTIVDKSGNSLINQVFEDCDIMKPDIWGSLNPDYYTLYGCYDGEYYWYTFKDGKFVLGEPWLKYKNTGSDDLYGYEITHYAYSSGFREILYGLNDSAGNVFFEPIFFEIDIPFNDRFILYTNNIDHLDMSMGYCSLVDEDKNILCTYSTINFYKFDDGTYIGIAWYSEYSDQILRDKNGEILKIGYYFIDKDGNELSPCFTLLSPLESIGIREFIELYSDVPISTTDADGNAVEVKASDYICKP